MEKGKRGGAQPGAGRPALPAEQRTELHSFRCTGEEWALMRATAKAAELTASQWARLVLVTTARRAAMRR